MLKLPPVSVRLYLPFAATGVPLNDPEVPEDRFREVVNVSVVTEAIVRSTPSRTSAPDFEIPQGGFFLWLKVKDDEEAAKILWNKFSLRVMPGSFMGKDIDGLNPGIGYLRISVVDKKEVIEETMKRIQLFLKSEIFNV